ncbi:hypothetical protein GWK26_12800 [haloarchaeon 3A1-DGR]|nr:hypothetical protein GWK26_12800 [haloarchaeon 3A1-DGR]
MPSTTIQTVPVETLDHDTKAPANTIDIERRDLASKTILEIAHGSEEWTLEFSESGSLSDQDPAPPATPPRWLPEVVDRVAPELSLR